MKKFSFFVILVAMILVTYAPTVSAQGNDHWDSHDGCNAAAVTNTAVMYETQIKNPQKVDETKGEKLVSYSSGSCAREHTKYGLVWIWRNAEFQDLQRSTGLYDPRCNNKIEEVRVVIVPPASEPTPASAPPKTESDKKVIVASGTAPVIYNYTTNITNNNPSPGSGSGVYDNNRNGGEQYFQYSGGQQVVYTSLPTVYVTPYIWFGGAYWDWYPGFGYRCRYGVSHGWHSGYHSGYNRGQNLGGGHGYGNHGTYSGGPSYVNRGGGRNYGGQSPSRAPSYGGGYGNRGGNPGGGSHGGGSGNGGGHGGSGGSRGGGHR